MRPFIIAGLGNPGREYENTRHNIGFLAVNKIATEWNIKISRVNFKSLTGEGIFANRRIILVKPQTYMNNSGNAIQAFVHFYKVDLKNLLIIHDDMDLPFGSLRMRGNGGSAGQRGMASIIKKLGSSDFARLRLGIGRPPGRMDPMDYVLQKFSSKMMVDLDLILTAARKAVETMLLEDIEKAMTQYNHSILDNA